MSDISVDDIKALADKASSAAATIQAGNDVPYEDIGTSAGTAIGSIWGPAGGSVGAAIGKAAGAIAGAIDSAVRHAKDFDYGDPTVSHQLAVLAENTANQVMTINNSQSEPARSVLAKSLYDSFMAGGPPIVVDKNGHTAWQGYPVTLKADAAPDGRYVAFANLKTLVAASQGLAAKFTLRGRLASLSLSTKLAIASTVVSLIGVGAYIFESRRRST